MPTLARSHRTIRVSLLVLFVMGLSFTVIGNSGCFLFLAQYAEYDRKLQAAIDALPITHVRVINRTNVAARVTFDSGITGPPYPFEITDGLGGPYLTSADSQTVIVAAGGTVDGTLKCGEVLAISAVTPGDLQSYYGGYSAESAFGLYTSAGNIQLSGVGSGGESDSQFTGDVQGNNLARFIRPGVDGYDCDAGTLVLEITAPGTLGVQDPQTGLFVGGATGTGVVSIQ